jgi:prepilin-type N-terminal cleavage/methylation domain-containing protein/prepilin-type processing-associated H-X9-DG protein
MQLALLPDRGAFSLIELLVVIAIIAVLSAMLLSSVGVVRSAAHVAVCQNNLRQMAVGFETYIQDNESFPMPQFHASAILVDSVAASVAGATSRRCPARTGRTDQFGALAGRPAQTYGMNAKLAPDQGDQQINAITQKLPTALKKPALAAVILETMQSEQWGGSQLVGYGFWLDRAGDLQRHRGSSNILFADWHVESRAKASVPRNRTAGDAVSWNFWTGIMPP